MWKHIGCSRFIWNYMLALQEQGYQDGEKHLSGFDMNKLLTPMRKETEYNWLKDVSARSLQRTCADLTEAYSRFFKKKSRRPKFKSKKRSKQSFPVRETIYFADGLVTIEKLGKMKYKTDFDLPQGKGCKFSNPRVTHVRGKWMLSFGIEGENQVYDLTDKQMGIDLGIKELATVAFGDECFVFHNINKSKKMRFLKKKLVHTQKAISRKYEANKVGSKFVKTKNIERLEDKQRQIHAKIANIRNNYIHQTTHTMVSMLPNKVTMEDLNVTGMMKNRHLSNAVQEQCFYEFIRQMKYKCEWRGIEFVQADRFFPSSKTCSVCGNIKADLKLKDRTYVCECCGAVIDRDYNAAINLMKYVA